MSESGSKLYLCDKLGNRKEATKSTRKGGELDGGIKKEVVVIARKWNPAK